MCARKGDGTSDCYTKEQREILDSNLANGIPESERKEIYYFLDRRIRNIGPTTPEKEIINNIANIPIIQRESVLVNEDIPTIEGKSEKQIKYAKDVIERKTRNYIKNLTESALVADGQARQQNIDSMIDGVNRSGGNAKTFSDAINWMLKNHKKSPLKYAKEHPNARDILDKYASY